MLLSISSDFICVLTSLKAFYNCNDKLMGVSLKYSMLIDWFVHAPTRLDHLQTSGNK